MSVGGAMMRRDEHWEDMLQRADQRLYEAKSAGRNCIVINDGINTASPLPIV